MSAGVDEDESGPGGIPVGQGSGPRAVAELYHIWVNDLEIISSATVKHIKYVRALTRPIDDTLFIRLISKIGLHLRRANRSIRPSGANDDILAVEWASAGACRKNCWMRAQFFGLFMAYPVLFSKLVAVAGGLYDDIPGVTFNSVLGAVMGHGSADPKLSDATTFETSVNEANETGESWDENSEESSSTFQHWDSTDTPYGSQTSLRLPREASADAVLISEFERPDAEDSATRIPVVHDVDAKNNTKASRSVHFSPEVLDIPLRSPQEISRSISRIPKGPHKPALRLDAAADRTLARGSPLAGFADTGMPDKPDDAHIRHHPEGRGSVSFAARSQDIE
ncbi:hypothetical protein PENSPDRAFT_753865 [Peniophora sp. CONT]|nr:hypothetical protein PENSPDRAFT_753865 [Peniophora sp. CONT]